MRKTSEELDEWEPQEGTITTHQVRLLDIFDHLEWSPDVSSVTFVVGCDVCHEAWGNEFSFVKGIARDTHRYAVTSLVQMVNNARQDLGIRHEWDGKWRIVK